MRGHRAGVSLEVQWYLSFEGSTCLLTGILASHSAFAAIRPKPAKSNCISVQSLHGSNTGKAALLTRKQNEGDTRKGCLWAATTPLQCAGNLEGEIEHQLPKHDHCTPTTAAHDLLGRAVNDALVAGPITFFAEAG